MDVMVDDNEEAREEARRAGREAYRRFQTPEHLVGTMEGYLLRRKAYVRAYAISIRRSVYSPARAKPCACRFLGTKMPGLPTLWSDCTSRTAGDSRSIFANGHSVRVITRSAKTYLSGGQIYHAESPEEPLTPMQMFSKLGMSITEEKFLNAVERIRRHRFRVDGPEDYLAKVTAHWAHRQVSGRSPGPEWGRRRVPKSPPPSSSSTP